MKAKKFLAVAVMALTAVMFSAPAMADHHEKKGEAKAEATDPISGVFGLVTGLLDGIFGAISGIFSGGGDAAK